MKKLFQLEQNGTNVRTEIIGDCRKPGMIRAATFRGYHAAMDL